MSLFFAKLIAAGLIFMIAVLAGIYPFKQNKNTEIRFGIGEALASGVFLGAGLLHMLPDSASDFASLHLDYPIGFLIAGVTFLILLWLEHIGREISHDHANQGSLFAVLATVMLSIHSLLAGAALGLSTNIEVFGLVLVAILAHKWAAAFALAITINKYVSKRKVGILLFSAFAIMTPLGIFLGEVVSKHVDQSPWLVPVFTSMAAGTFIYLGTLHGLDRGIMVKKCCNIRDYSFVILGFALMAIVALWA